MTTPFTTKPFESNQTSLLPSSVERPPRLPARGGEHSGRPGPDPSECAAHSAGEDLPEVPPLSFRDAWTRTLPGRLIGCADAPTLRDARVLTNKHTYMHTYIHTYIRTYIHTCMHTYMHAYILCDSINVYTTCTQRESSVSSSFTVYSDANSCLLPTVDKYHQPTVGNTKGTPKNTKETRLLY